MICEDGICKITGASDFQDATHLLGILSFIDHAMTADATRFIVDGKYVRHPTERKYDMSRDQAIMLMFSLYKQNRPDLIDLRMVDGKDLFSPAVGGMIRIMKGKKAFFWQKWWFKKELQLNWNFQELREPFQLIVMCEVYGADWLKMWVNRNSSWKWSIRRYLSELDGAWRGEAELAELVIAKIEGKTNWL